MSMIRWGILGCGDVTEVKSGPALQKTPRSSVIACMRRDAAKADDYAARHGIPKAYSDADALIADPEVDAIYIATPPSSHAELAIKALRADKPVLVEKPMALSADECDAMIAASEEAQKSLIVAHYRRALPRFEKMRAIVRDGTIGTPRCVFVRHFMRAEDQPKQSWKRESGRAGGGAFWDMQVHILDWLDHVFGPTKSAAGIARQQSQASASEDLISYTIGYESVVASGLCCYAAGRTDEGVTVYGSKGSVTMSFMRPSPLIIEQQGVRSVHDLPDPKHVHQPFVAQVVDHLLDGTPNPCSAEAAQRTTALIAQLYA